MMIDMIGRTFGSLTVVEKAATKSHGQLRWRCLCICGANHEVSGGHLRTGNVTSCGCQKAALCAAANHKHGSAIRGQLTPEYRVWSNMIERCERVANRSYPDYGGRGISICDRWRKSFADFFADVGLKPTPSHMLDRIKSDGNYEPGNIRWATRTEQNRNRRSNINITFNGQTKCLGEWAQIVGIKYLTMYMRHQRGWSVDKMLSASRSTRI